jgi:hypothetical protein
LPSTGKGRIVRSRCAIPRRIEDATLLASTTRNTSQTAPKGVMRLCLSAAGVPLGRGQFALRVAPV